MESKTISPKLLLQANDPKSIYRRLEDVERYIEILKKSSVSVNAVSEITTNLGILTSGEFRSGNGLEIDSGFTGIRIGYPGFLYDCDYWSIAGIDDDILQFGMRHADGKIYAGGGAVILDNTGISARLGDIGNWTLGDCDIIGGNTTLHSSGYIRVGTGDTIVELSSVDSDYRIWVGNASPALASFSVDKYGVLNATGATISGSITAEVGYVGGWTIDCDSIYSTNIDISSASGGVITVGSGPVNIIIEGSSSQIRSSNYISGSTGFMLDGTTGMAEFQNVVLRGQINSSTISKGELVSNVGDFGVYYSGGMLLNDATVAASFSIDIKDPTTGHILLFNIGDVLRYKSGSIDTWMLVTGFTDNTTYYSYAVDKQSGSNGTLLSGTSITDYGQSGDGFLVITADTDYGPSIRIMTHAGSPWSTTTEVARIGNLNGFLGYSADYFGLGLNHGTLLVGNNNVKIDGIDGIQIYRKSSGVLKESAITWYSQSDFTDAIGWIEGYNTEGYNTLDLESYSTLDTDSLSTPNIIRMRNILFDETNTISQVSFIESSIINNMPLLTIQIGYDNSFGGPHSSSDIYAGTRIEDIYGAKIQLGYDSDLIYGTTYIKFSETQNILFDDSISLQAWTSGTPFPAAVGYFKLFVDSDNYLNTLSSGGTITKIGYDCDLAKIGSGFVIASADATMTGARVLTAGANISITDNGAGSTIEISSAAAGHTIQSDGIDMTARTNLNFIGDEVVDDLANDATIIRNWNVHKQTVATGTTVEIESDESAVFAGAVTVDGTLNVYGNLVIL